jgi:hypothetical protein
MANAWDQVEVFYGGRKLLKPTTNTVIGYNKDVVAFDSNETNSYGTQSNVIVLPEFTITNTATNPTLTLNIDVEPGFDLSVVQRRGQSIFKLHEFDTTSPGVTVLRPGQEFIEPVNNFLQESPAALPNDSYYGGDTVIILETGAVLQDELGNPIEGI